MIIGDIEVLHETYELGTTDFDKDGTHQSFTVFEGTDEQVQNKIDLMKTEMNRINAEGYDYNLPIVEAIVGDGWGDLNDQNSNTVAMELARAANLENES